ncbi:MULTISPECIES: porin family protein [unclassified Cellulophaga]|uniref:porin family protein n=1 Tax=unclassified Cellulophaga TaxID=2634405 RepID=UPI0026E15F1B|nr:MULTISPECIES: porin family protein [unclassified Cellulophaga]MDO6492899.1 porin family protein [Cellulophaga sp. 2_MG-2023]MDO6496401.1 porin family protein [Cellulophaga sp. 3_MG-2023]
MKKIILLSFLITSLSYSQSDESKLSFGASLGANISFFNTAVSELGYNESLGYSNSVRVSAKLDLSTFYRINDYLRLESGLTYVGKGTEYRRPNRSVIVIDQNGSDTGYDKTRFRLDYIEIPLKANINLKKLFKSKNFEQMPIYFNVGLSGGFNTKSDIRSNSYIPSSSNGGFVVNVEENFEIREFDFAKPFIVNSIVGFSYVFKEINKNKFTVDLEYSQSLQDVYEEKDIESSYNFKTKNGSISLSVGIEFN